MRSIIILLFSILATMETFSQNRTTDRQPVAAGSFYPADKESLTKDLIQRFENCIKSPGNWNVRAIISPHAGYVFSGKVAASAFSSIPGNSVYKNIFIIGSSHIMAFNGASVYSSGDYITPLGRVEVNKKIANTLKQEHKVFNFPEEAHAKEHSIEVQVPFIQYYFKNKPLIVPIIIGTEDEVKIKQIAEALRPWFKPENLFIISSDFSHYPPYKDAVEVDNTTAIGIISGNPLTFLEVLRKNSARKVSGLATSMCGWTSCLTLLYLTTGNSMLEYKLVDYCNSGDSPYGGKNEVVGYNAIAVVEKMQNIKSTQEAGNEFSFNDEERLMLFKIAKSSILSRLTGKKVALPDEKDMSSKFKTQMGAFVTLKMNGSLRGCIGRFISSDPLYKVVDASAYSSAFEDPRFLPLTMEEFKKTDFEITVLGPLKKINNINEIVLGKHGIYIKKGINSGTMLPQVATENGWTVEEFLGYTSREKVGIGYDGWRDAEIFIYEGVVLEDNNK